MLDGGSSRAHTKEFLRALAAEGAARPFAVVCTHFALRFAYQGSPVGRRIGVKHAGCGLITERGLLWRACEMDPPACGGVSVSRPSPQIGWKTVDLKFGICESDLRVGRPGPGRMSCIPSPTRGGVLSWERLLIRSCISSLQ